MTCVGDKKHRSPGTHLGESASPSGVSFMSKSSIANWIRDHQNVRCPWLWSWPGKSIRCFCPWSPLWLMMVNDTIKWLFLWLMMVNLIHSISNPDLGFKWLFPKRWLTDFFFAHASTAPVSWCSPNGLFEGLMLREMIKKIKTPLSLKVAGH